MWYPQVTIAFNTKKCFNFGWFGGTWESSVLHHFTLFALCLRSLSIHGLWTSLHRCKRDVHNCCPQLCSFRNQFYTIIYMCVCVLEDIICVYLYIINYILYIYTTSFLYLIYFSYYFCCVGTCDHNCNSTFLAQLIPRLRLFRLRIVHLRLHLVPRSPTAGRKSLDIDASGAFQDVLANFWSRDFC